MITHNHSTRSRSNINYATPKPDTTAFLKFIDYKGIKLYNHLPKKNKKYE